MEELNELRLDNGLLVLDGNRVKSAIIPRSYRDMDNEIAVKGEAMIDGAVYTRRLTIENGPLTVCGALFAKSGIFCRSANDKRIVFKKSVVGGDLMEMFDAGRKLFGADVNAGIVKLRNAIVAASVFGAEIHLENCVVLGGVFATKQLKISNCVFGTFNAPSATIAGDNYMLCPSVFSVEPLHVQEGTRLFNITLADWGALLKGEPEAPLSGMVQLNFASDEQKISLKDAEGNTSLWETYSIAGKVLATDLLDLGKLDNHFILSVGSMCEQLIRQYDLGRDKDGKPIPLTLETIGEFFLSIQSGRTTVKPIDGTISFEDLKRFYAD